MEIRLKDVKTGRHNGKRLHAIFHKGVELWPKEPYPTSANKIYYTSFVMDGKTKYGTNNHFQDQNNDDIGYSFSRRTDVAGFNQSLQTNRFGFSFWIKVKSSGTSRANQGFSVNFGHFIVMNLKHRERNYENRFEYKSGRNYYAGPSEHGLNDGRRHFVTINMEASKFQIFIDGVLHWDKANNAPMNNRNFNVSGPVRLVHDGSPNVEYSQVVFHKNTISPQTHQRWYNAMKEYFLSDYQ